MLMEISTPSGLEPSGLDDRRFDVPRRHEFLVQGFGKPFQSEFASTVVSEARYCVVSASAADVEDILALVGGGILSKKLDGLQRDLCRSPE